MGSRLYFGYVCTCGLRVVVFEFEVGVTRMLPDSVTITCAKGHVTTFTADQYAMLDPWSEEAA